MHKAPDLHWPLQCPYQVTPQWHNENDEKGASKVIMAGSASDILEWQPHVRNKPRREVLAKRFKDPKDPLEVVLVRDLAGGPASDLGFGGWRRLSDFSWRRTGTGG